MRRRIEGAGTPEENWEHCPVLAHMPDIALDTLVPQGCRAVFVAPHPDDETLGTGGLLSSIAAAGNDVLIVAATDGQASHPGSSQFPPGFLTKQRAAERAEALQHLGVGHARVIRAGLADGALAAGESALTGLLSRVCSKNDVVFAPWRFDGHPDHEAAYRAARRYASSVGAKMVEVPIWMWHWASPADPRIPWWRGRKFHLDAQTVERKRSAIAAYSSQTASDPSTGRPAVLTAATLARFLRPFETVFV